MNVINFNLLDTVTSYRVPSTTIPISTTYDHRQSIESKEFDEFSFNDVDVASEELVTWPSTTTEPRPTIRIRNTQILEISTPKYSTPADDPPAATEVEDNSTKLMFPTKETLEFFGFTSGHQNNFGVPIEEDERVLRMLNEQLIKSQRERNRTEETLTTTTDANAYRTHVSPTLPVVQKLDATTERFRVNATEDGKY